MIPEIRLLEGDAMDVLRTLPDESAQTCCTSPPYFHLRDYGHGDRQIGRELDPAEYVERLVLLFREVRRTLRRDGTLWLNLGDSYARRQQGHVKPKDLLGLPWAVAFALRADGWHLRGEGIWNKPNVLPAGGLSDRFHRSHEHVFLLSRSSSYFYDAEAVKEDAKTTTWPGVGKKHASARGDGERGLPMVARARRHLRSVWTIPTVGHGGAHCAPFPPDLAMKCILAGTPARAAGEAPAVVLDPFIGSGTTALVAAQLGRSCVGIDLDTTLAVHRLRSEAAPHVLSAA